MRRVLFIPLDDRPATRATVLDLLPLLGAAWDTPPRDLLGHRRRPADLDALFRWAEREAASADALIAPAEVFIHGGLVPSRLSVDPLEVLWRRLDRLVRLADRVPTYLSAANPRIPAGGADEEPGYWAEYGDRLRAYSTHLDAGGLAGDDARVRRALEALDGVPAAIVDDFLRRRRRQLLVNLELILLAAQGRLAALLIGQDDADPYGFTRADLTVLQRFRERCGAGRACVSVGADELGARLLARLAVDASGRSPRVAVRYTYPEARRSVPRYEPFPLEDTVAGHLEAAGCTVAAGDAEILLWVHNFAGAQQRESRDQRGAPPAPVRTVAAALAEAASRGIVCGCADVRFANGADDALVRSLLAREDLAGLAGYAGWNTCSNTLGTVLAQVVLAYGAQSHLGEARFRQIRRRYLTRRLLDDWGYQTVVRPYLADEVVGALGADATHLGPAAPAVREAALRRFHEEILPPVERALGPAGFADLAFPWDRLFEVEVRFADEPPGM
ncbi:MAG: DUF4127 family protein [Armatimonadota bacterium]|nr:DUF4127 family protein [Armatimonadota bacterium]MDR7550406.1 DUF4127 family protein [Armatimonadota bacterium]